MVIAYYNEALLYRSRKGPKKTLIVRMGPRKRRPK